MKTLRSPSLFLTQAGDLLVVYKIETPTPRSRSRDLAGQLVAELQPENASGVRRYLWDTESWVANTDDRIAGVVATNRASGYDRALDVYIGNVATISNHRDRQFPGPVMTWPPAASIGAVQHFLGERPFREILFKNGLLWAWGVFLDATALAGNRRCRGSTHCELTTPYTFFTLG